MEREDSTALIELGTASSDTHGTPVPGKAEPIGFYPLGLSDQ